jgi:hypothetical protein
MVSTSLTTVGGLGDAQALNKLRRQRLGQSAACRIVPELGFIEVID